MKNSTSYFQYSNKTKQKYIGIDLFAGAGGMALGAQLAGIDVVLAIECNKYAAETYKYNHPNTKVLNNDISWKDFLKNHVKEKTIIFYCKMGVSSKRAAEKLAEEGYNAGSLGSFTAWKMANLPIKKKPF